MSVCTFRREIMIVSFVAVLMTLSAYLGYAYSECSWSRLLVLNDLMQIKNSLEVIQATREGKTEVAINKININIESALGRVKHFDSIGSGFIDDFKYKTLSSLRKEWHFYPYPSVNYCVYDQVQDSTLKYKMEEHCLGLRQYLNQYQ